MMSQIATLRQAAQHVRIATFKSMPWGQRVARFLVAVLGDTAKAFDGALTKELEKQGFPSNVTRLVRGTGKQISDKLGGRKTPEMVEDAMVMVLVDMARGKFDFQKGDTVYGPDEAADKMRSIQSYLTTAVNFKLNDERKKLKKQREREQSLFDTELKDFDPADQSAYDAFAELLDGSSINELKRKLNAVLPWGGHWLAMSMEGWKDNEIIGDKDKGKPSELAAKLGMEWLPNPKGLPMTMGMWSKPGGWKDKLTEVITDHLREEREEDLEDMPGLFTASHRRGAAKVDPKKVLQLVNFNIDRLEQAVMAVRACRNQTLARFKTTGDSTLDAELKAIEAMLAKADDLLDNASAKTDAVYNRLDEART